MLLVFVLIAVMMSMSVSGIMKIMYQDLVLLWKLCFI